MSQLNNKEMTRKVKTLLGIFDKGGIASKERFLEVNSQNHPGVLLPDFESVIVFAKGSGSDDPAGMGSFDDYFGTIAAQSDVIDYLDNLGYTTVMIEGTNNDVSLVKMGMEAGVGEISPVNSLVVRGLGLTASLGAILTNAPLMADEKVEGVCIKCMKCLRVCPIRDIPNAKGDLSKCACGKCKNSCPV